MQGIDCATPLTRDTAKAVASKGYGFACRYLVPEKYGWKRLTRGEAEAISEAGMKIISVFETIANGAAGGGAAGAVDGAAALHEAQLVGQPAGSAIYFAVDFDAQYKHFDAIEAYFRAAAAAVPGYICRPYGSYAVVEEMVRRKVTDYGWQTYAWSQGKKSAKAALYQYKNGQTVGGVQVDLNESYGNEGWWNTLMNQDDAQKIIAVLGAAWNLDERNAGGTALTRDEIHRLANTVRKAAGLPST